MQARRHVWAPALRVAPIELLAQSLRIGHAARQLGGVARPFLGRGLHTIQREVQRVVGARQRLAHQPVPRQARIVGAAPARQMALDEFGGQRRLNRVQRQRGVLVQRVRQVERAGVLAAA
jgi:hypothetical protein